MYNLLKQYFEEDYPGLKVTSYTNLETVIYVEFNYDGNYFTRDVELLELLAFVNNKIDNLTKTLL